MHFYHMLTILNFYPIRFAQSSHLSIYILWLAKEKTSHPYIETYVFGSIQSFTFLFAFLVMSQLN